MKEWNIQSFGEFRNKFQGGRQFKSSLNLNIENGKIIWSIVESGNEVRHWIAIGFKEKVEYRRYTNFESRNLDEGYVRR